MEYSLFTKIIRGDIPCSKVYEDAHTFAFLDIHPVQPGQVLVVPKQQVDFIWNLESAEYQALMATVQKVGKRLQEVLGRNRVGVMVEGLDIANHAHVKIIPFDTEQEYRTIPDMDAEPDFPALTEIAARIRMEDGL